MAIRRSAVVGQLQAVFDGGTIAGLTDAQLLERFTGRRGESAEIAFAGVVARHGPMVLGVCRGLLRNSHDAEDAFQATFLLLARKAGSLRRPELVGPWLHGVAHRCARQIRTGNERRRKREAEAAMSGNRPAGHAVRQEPDLGTREDVEALHEEIERLPERYRTAVVLCELQGMTHEEAARRIGRPVGTVSARLSRARERLRGNLSRRGVVLPATALGLALNSTQASAMPPALVDSTIKIAMAVSAGVTAGVVPATIVSLSQGVAKSMFLTKLKVVSGVVLLSAASLGGVTVVAQQISAPRQASRPNVPAPNSVAAPAEVPAKEVALNAEVSQEPAVAVAQDEALKPRKDSVEAPVVQGIEIDGSLDDWPAAMPRYPIGKLLEGEPNDRLGYVAMKGQNLSTSPDLSAAFSVGYDPNEQLLYLGVIVRDDKLVIGHDSHLDSDALEVYVDGLRSERRVRHPGVPDLVYKLPLANNPVQQYIAIPGTGTIYGQKSQNTNPILIMGDLKKTKTRMAFKRKGDVTTYEWAIQVFDKYPESPTKLVPGKRIGFDISVVDKDTPSSTPGGVEEQAEDRTVWIYWGPRWNGIKVLDAGGLGEIVLVK